MRLGLFSQLTCVVLDKKWLISVKKRLDFVGLWLNTHKDMHFLPF